MTEIDHLVFAAADLADGIGYIEALTGIRPVLGGPHRGLGTRNALLCLGETVYLEIIAHDPDQPVPSRRRPFGLDDGLAPRLASFAVHPGPGETLAHVVATAATAGLSIGEPLAMSRLRPDGVELRWRLTPPHFGAMSGLVPFVIDWGQTPSPAASAPAGCSLVSLRAEYPDPGALEAAYAALGLNVPIDETATARLTAVLDTPHGLVELR